MDHSISANQSVNESFDRRRLFANRKVVQRDPPQNDITGRRLIRNGRRHEFDLASGFIQRRSPDHQLGALIAGLIGDRVDNFAQRKTDQIRAFEATEPAVNEHNPRSRRPRRGLLQVVAGVEMMLQDLGAQIARERREIVRGCMQRRTKPIKSRSIEFEAAVRDMQRVSVDSQIVADVEERVSRLEVTGLSPQLVQTLKRRPIVAGNRL